MSQLKPSSSRSSWLDEKLKHEYSALGLGKGKDERNPLGLGLEGFPLDENVGGLTADSMAPDCDDQPLEL